MFATVYRHNTFSLSFLKVCSCRFSCQRIYLRDRQLALRIVVNKTAPKWFILVLIENILSSFSFSHTIKPVSFRESTNVSIKRNTVPRSASKCAHNCLKVYIFQGNPLDSIQVSLHWIDITNTRAWRWSLLLVLRAPSVQIQQVFPI